VGDHDASAHWTLTVREPGLGRRVRASEPAEDVLSDLSLDQMLREIEADQQQQLTIARPTSNISRWDHAFCRGICSLRRENSGSASMNSGASADGVRVPLPGKGRATVVEPPPATGPGNWVGAPSAALDSTGAVVLAYRVRVADGRGITNKIARSTDGERFTMLATIDRQHVHAVSLERPALVRTPEDVWRLYVSCALPGKDWRIDLLEADDPTALGGAQPETLVFDMPNVAVKDPVIRRTESGWEAWICCHPLDEPGEEDRMRTVHMTSDDGRSWRDLDIALEGRSGHWDERGTRVTSVMSSGWATYDGRASKEENFSEKTGIARPDERRGRFIAVGDGPVSDARYLEILELPDGRCRLYYEAPLADGSHELRTEIVSPDRG